MSSHATTYSSFHLQRARVFFLARSTQHVERQVAREVGRAGAAAGCPLLPPPAPADRHWVGATRTTRQADSGRKAAGTSPTVVDLALVVFACAAALFAMVNQAVSR